MKSFYLRDDVVAAKTVVGILREVEIADMREREKRNRARRDGMLRKKMKMTWAYPTNIYHPINRMSETRATGSPE